MKKITLSIPNRLCDLCNTIKEKEEDFEGFDDKMLLFVNSTTYKKFDNNCDFCEKCINHVPITLSVDEPCEQCDNPVESSFCSKECVSKFIKQINKYIIYYRK